ncbi:AAA family ATPase [Candidatus Bathyarchaeota archaeon]|nr:AAA family ATPase [Candidatus Bathyarchaeota archaeon]
MENVKMRLQLRNFKGVKNGEVEFAPLTILIGPNNSGKTTILEALFLAPNPFREVPYILPGGSEPATAAEVVHSMHQTLESSGYLFLLRNYMTNKAEIDWNGLSLNFFKRNEKIDVIINKKFSKYITIVDRELYKVGELYTKFDHMNYIREIRHDLISRDVFLFNSALVKPGFEYLRDNWTPIVNTGVCKRIARDVSELIQEDYVDLTMEPFVGKISINAYLRDGRRMRLGDLGEGVQNYIIARILYESGDYRVLLWDDIESHMNPVMLLAIAEWFLDLMEKDNQIILTTHSLEAARVIASMAEDRCSICLTSMENGVLCSKKLSLKEVEDLIEAGIDVRSTTGLIL